MTGGADCSHLMPPRASVPTKVDNNNGIQKHHHQQQQQQRNTQHRTDNPSNMTFIGISSTVESVSDAAIQFLIEAACVHNIKSYILLGDEGTKSNKPLKQKILAMIYHFHLPLPDIEAHLHCVNLIRVRVAPDKELLLNMTRSHMNMASSSSVGGELLKSNNTPNNPLDPDNRIAKIKRSREYQRQQLLQNQLSWGPYFYDWKSHSVIGVLDLDLFGYPRNISDVVETASRYILPSTGGSTGDDDTIKYHAICANGLQVSEGRRSYYDIFSTILLPNTWLHRQSDREVRRGALDGEDVNLAKMSQTQTLKWFLKEGRINHSHSGVNTNNNST